MGAVAFSVAVGLHEAFFDDDDESGIEFLQEEFHLDTHAVQAIQELEKRHLEQTAKLVAELREDGLDLSEEDIEKFKEKIGEAKMIVWAGAMGFYEKENCRKGTEEIARAIAENNSYKIIAGGDTAASIVSLGLKNKIDFICSGGGVMLEFLIKGSLPAWE